MKPTINAATAPKLESDLRLIAREQIVAATANARTIDLTPKGFILLLFTRKAHVRELLIREFH
jgi:hypothetical protein